MNERSFRPVADSPVGVTLRDVAVARGLLAVVGENGDILRRVDDQWVVLERGVGGGDILYGADATDDGRRVWWVGGNGNAGYRNIGNETTHEYDIPGGESDFRSVTVAGPAGRESIWTVNDEGVVSHGSPDGGGNWTWRRERPADGETFFDITHAPGRPVATSENGVAYVRRDDGWQDVGIDAPSLLHAVAATSDGLFFGSEDVVYVPREDGWSPSEISNDTVMDITARADQVLAATENGDVYAYTDEEWRQLRTDCESVLHAIDGRDTIVAVGDDGTILEWA